MSRLLITSDTHLGHANILDYCSKTRPFAPQSVLDAVRALPQEDKKRSTPMLMPYVQEMNERLISNWNAVVRPEDTVIHVGDFAMGPKSEHYGFLARLNGRKEIVPGNHDKRELLEKMGWDVVHDDQMFLNYQGTTLWISHIPYGDMDEYDHRDYLQRPAATQPYDLILCGHVHSKWKTFNGNINVGVDQWNLTPVDAAMLIAFGNELKNLGSTRAQ